MEQQHEPHALTWTRSTPDRSMTMMVWSLLKPTSFNLGLMNVLCSILALRSYKVGRSRIRRSSVSFKTTQGLIKHSYM